MEIQARPSPQWGQSSKTRPIEWTRTVSPSPAVMESPDAVTAYAIWWVRQNWHLAECRKILAGEMP